MSSSINLKLGSHRVSVKFPHDTPALVGTMQWNSRREEYTIVWDEGQQYKIGNLLDPDDPREWVNDAYVTIEGESAARLGGTALVTPAERTMRFSESRLTLGKGENASGDDPDKWIMKSDEDYEDKKGIEIPRIRKNYKPIESEEGMKIEKSKEAIRSGYGSEST